MSAFSAGLLWPVANAFYHQQKDNSGVTEIIAMPIRGHALTVDNRGARGLRYRPDLHQALRPLTSAILDPEPLSLVLDAVTGGGQHPA